MRDFERMMVPCLSRAARLVLAAALAVALLAAAASGRAGAFLGATADSATAICEPGKQSPARHVLVINDAASAQAGAYSGWLRLSDRYTLALAATSPNAFRVLAPDVEGTIEIGNAQLVNEGVDIDLRIAKGPCRAGRFRLAFDAPLSPPEEAAITVRLTRLFALESALEQSWEPAPKDYASMPARVSDIVQSARALLPDSHPEILFARAYLGHAFLAAEQPERALAELEAVEKLQLQTLAERDHDVLRARQFRVLALEDLNREKEAIALGEQLIRDAELGLGAQHPLYWRILATVGQRHFQARDYRRAYELCERAYLGMLALLGEEHLESLSLASNLAVSLQVLFRWREAVPMLEHAVAIADRHLGRDHRVSLLLLDRLARAYYSTGDWQKGVVLAERVGEAARRLFPPGNNQRSGALRLLAWWYHTLGRYAEAEALLRESLAEAIAVLGPSHPRVAEDRTELARVLLDRNRPDAAFANADMIYRQLTHEGGASGHRALWVRETRARALTRLGRNEEALGEALAIANGLRLLYGAGSGHARSAMILAGRNLSLLGRHTEALEILAAVEEEEGAARGAAHAKHVEALAERARAELRAARQEMAADTMERLIAEVETLREEIGPVEEYRQGILDRWSPQYRQLALTDIELGRTARAFDVIELAKARTLLESLSARRADGAGLLDAAESEQLRKLASELALRNEILGATEAAAPGRSDALHAKAQASRALREYRELLARRHPRYGQLLSIRLRGAQDAAQLVPPDAVFVSYALVGESALAFAYTRERGLEAKIVSVPGGMLELVRAYRSLLAPAKGRVRQIVWRLRDGHFRLDYVRPEPDAKAVRDHQVVGEYLAGLLLRPFSEALSGKRKWIIAPDESLALLPIEALPWRGGAVVESREVSYVQSLSVLAQLQSVRPRAGTAPSLLAMGDPDYQRPEKATPAGEKIDTTAAADSRVLARLRERRWKPLPGTAGEVAQIAARFSAERKAVYFRQAASEEKLQSLAQQGRLPQYRYLLFATHGWLNLEAPQLSAVVLAQAATTAEADGYVTAAEWLRYELDSDLIVLSGCETALGPTVRGEGVTGLPYALLVAGNRRTLLSLWKVDDQATAKLIPAVFEHLQAGRSPASALRLAKRSLLRNPKYRAPEYWAPFVLYGG